MTIVGDPAPRIRSTPAVGGSGDQPPAILLSGSGTQSLSLVNVVVRDTPPWGWNRVGEGIRGSGFSRIYIERSTIEAMAWGIDAERSIPAIDTPQAHVVVVESNVTANSINIGYTDPYNSFPNTVGFHRGAPGIIAGQVTALFSQIRGGNASSSLSFYLQPPTPCPCSHFTYGGGGGDATSAGKVFATPGSLIGGRGSEIRYLSSTTNTWVSNGFQPNGRGMPANGVVLQGSKIQGNALALGQTWNLSFTGLAGSGVLALGLPSPQPLAFGSDWLMVQPTGMTLIALSQGQSTWQYAVPNLPSLAGFELAGQIFDGGLGRLTAPILRAAAF